MTDQAPVAWILGIKVCCVTNGIFVSQGQYSLDMLVEAGLCDMEVKGQCVPLST